MKARKAFFFEKKKQKTFATGACVETGVGSASAGACRTWAGVCASGEVKVFCFFFSKKKALLALDEQLPPDQHTPYLACSSTYLVKFRVA